MQLSYKTAMANSMGTSVSVDDVTITSVTFSTRRSGSATVSSSVALTDAAEARKAVAALEAATGTGSFVSSMKAAAKDLGITLPANLAGAPVTGTSSKGLSVPAKYANADNSANGGKTTTKYVTVQSSGDSSEEKMWRATAIAFMAAFGIALVGMIALSVYSWKQKSRPKQHVMGSTLGMNAEGGMDAGDNKIDVANVDDDTENDAAAIQVMAVELNDVRARSGSSTTHRVDLDAVYGDIPEPSDDLLGQI